MAQEFNIKHYQKPELIYIDDSAFDETGQGTSGYPGEKEKKEKEDKDKDKDKD